MPHSHKIALIGTSIDRIATLATDLVDCNIIALASDQYQPMLNCLHGMRDVDAVLLELPPAPQSCQFAEACLALGVTELGTPLFCIGDDDDPALARLGHCRSSVIGRAATNGEIIAQILAGLKRQTEQETVPLVPVMDNFFWALRHMHRDQTELFGDRLQGDILWPLLVELAFLGPARTLTLSQLALTLQCPELDVLRAATRLAEQRLVELRHLGRGRRRIEVGISRLGAFRMVEYLNRYRSHFDAVTTPTPPVATSDPALVCC